jgi:hypothetical protein
VPPSAKSSQIESLSPICNAQLRSDPEKLKKRYREKRKVPPKSTEEKNRKKGKRSQVTPSPPLKYNDNL